MMDHAHWRNATCLIVTVCLIALAVWRSGLMSDRTPPSVEQRAMAPLVMGTTSRLIAVGRPEFVESALAAALAELQRLERLMSTYDPHSEISQFNAAPVGQIVRLSSETMQVLYGARDLALQTDGAFDVTVGPLIKLWSEAARHGTPPTADELARVRQYVGHDKLELRDDYATKLTTSLELSLDGIAKGFAIDRALAAMKRFELQGALVEVGGDLACFGHPQDSSAWQIAVQDPWGAASLMQLQAPASDRAFAVCTSGHYYRFVEIQGQRYSHILDPRSGQPVEHTASVSVIGQSAMLADGWATALSVLGSAVGLPLITEANSGLEALIVTGSAGTSRMDSTPGWFQFTRPFSPSSAGLP